MGELETSSSSSVAERRDESIDLKFVSDCSNQRADLFIPITEMFHIKATNPSIGKMKSKTKMGFSLIFDPTFVRPASRAASLETSQLS
jgi:hypothetical protein